MRNVLVSVALATFAQAPAHAATYVLDISGTLAPENSPTWINTRMYQGPSPIDFSTQMTLIDPVDQDADLVTARYLPTPEPVVTFGNGFQIGVKQKAGWSPLVVDGTGISFSLFASEPFFDNSIAWQVARWDFFAPLPVQWSLVDGSPASLSLDFYSKLVIGDGDPIFGAAFVTPYNGKLTLTGGSMVPEPEAWMMLVVGFGALGCAVRAANNVGLRAGTADNAWNNAPLA